MWATTTPTITAAQATETGTSRGLSIAAKLQLKSAQSVSVLAEPEGVNLELSGYSAVADPGAADAVIVFCENRDQLERLRSPLVAAAKRDALAWLAYPKAGQRNTDLNRERVSELMAPGGVRPVRQIALDDVWSALRFRAA
jgi:hypothetical protein